MLAARGHDGSTILSLRPSGSPDRDRREAVLAFAAHEARLLDLGKDSDFLLRLECRDDFRAARALGLRHVPEEDLIAWLDDRRQEAHALVAADWDAIKAVTAAILARRKLSGPEVRAIVLGDDPSL